MSDRTRRIGALVLSGSLVFIGTVFAGSASALPTTSAPRLTLNRLIRTSPCTATSIRVRDNEGLAYVAADNAMWMADDNTNSVYEIDRATGALRRQINVTAFVNAPRLGVGSPAGTSRNQDLEAMAYGANADSSRPSPLVPVGGWPTAACTSRTDPRSRPPTTRAAPSVRVSRFPASRGSSGSTSTMQAVHHLRNHGQSSGRNDR